MLDEGNDWKHWLIAHAIWMLDGRLYLGDPEAQSVLYERIQELAPHIVESLLGAVLDLNQRTNKALELVPVFCQEYQARLMWRQLQGHSYPSVRQIGIPGIENLGTNTAQRMWSAYNVIEDLNEKFEASWSHAKFVASAMSPKGVEQISKADRSAKEEKELQRQELFDRTYYIEKGILDREDRLAGTDTVLPKVITASTEEDLIADMHRAISGEMDWHDQVIMAYKNRILDQQRKEVEDRQRRIAEARRKAELEGEETEAFQLVGYTLDELQERLGDLRYKPATVQDEGPQEYLTDRYLKEVEIGMINFNTMKVEKFQSKETAVLPTQGRKVEVSHG